jgi:two-component system, OmpR family, response regulator RegX3
MVSGVPHTSDRIVILTSSTSSVEELRQALEQDGFQILIVKSLEDAGRQQTDATFPLFLIDRLHFPLHHLKPRRPLFAKSLFVSFWPMPQDCSEEQFIKDMEAGVDDVLSGQTHRQLMAKIRALLRRQHAEAHPPQILRVGELQMDLAKHEVRMDGKLVSLTPKEFAILQCFLQAPGQAFSRQAMLSRVWGEEYALDLHALDVHVHALRHKIEKNPERPNLIVTVRGVGYKLKNE